MVATTINRPKKALYKNFSKLKRVQKQRRKKNLPKKEGAIPDVELVPKGVLKKRMTSSRANITLSGKKKRKIIKQLRRLETEQLKMDVCATTSKATKGTKQKGKAADKMDCS